LRIELSGGTPLGFTGNLNVKPGGDQQNRGWYLGPGITGQLALRIVALRRDSDAGAVLLPLRLAAEGCGLGARTQIGYGVVRCDDRLELPHLPASVDAQDSGDLPNLRDMFFAKFRFNVGRADWWKQVAGLATLDGGLAKWVASGSVPIAAAIKDCIRRNEHVALTLYREGMGDPRAAAPPVGPACRDEPGDRRYRPRWPSPRSGRHTSRPRHPRPARRRRDRA
jgi:hypothetical protein